MSSQRSNEWYLDAVFYELSVRAFRDASSDGHGDLRGLIEKLDYLRELGVDCLWLMPFYPSPLRDDGYDIADFCAIDPHFGTMEDFEELVRQAQARGIRILLDLVVNHTSAMHPWFIESRSSRENPKRSWYVWSDSDQPYQQARVIFLDTEPSNWTLDPQTGQYYWHRFYAEQPDLNFDNPEVQQAMLDVMTFWLEKGIAGFRVDAVPYLYEREGSNGENLPETHAFLKRMRAHMQARWPDAIMLCEANQPPEDVIHYLGTGDECQMAFHFPLMPRIFMALASGDGTKLREVIERTPAIPPGTQWCAFLRCHDELTLEMVSPEERQWMWDRYAPSSKMRLNLGIRRRLAPLLENDPARILLANRLLFSLPGAPILYYGDEIGMGDNLDLYDRNGLRTPMQWDSSLNAGFSAARQPFRPLNGDYEQVNVARQQADPASLLSEMRQLIRLRKRHLAFSRGDLHFIDTGNPSLMAFTRSYAAETILVIHNLSQQPQRGRIAAGSLAGQPLRDVLAGASAGRLHLDPVHDFHLEPGQSHWWVRSEE